jgi:uncharacterized protein YjdB
MGGFMRLTAIVTLAVLAGGCSSATSACTAELGAQYTPATQTLGVGASFTAAVALSTCGGGVHPADAISWASSDDAVAGVDAGSGLVIAHAPGVAYIMARGARYGDLPGQITVTVR